MKAASRDAHQRQRLIHQHRGRSAYHQRNISMALIFNSAGIAEKNKQHRRHQRKWRRHVAAKRAQHQVASRGGRRKHVAGISSNSVTSRSAQIVCAKQRKQRVSSGSGINHHRHQRQHRNSAGETRSIVSFINLFAHHISAWRAVAAGAARRIINITARESRWRNARSIISVANGVDQLAAARRDGWAAS